MSKTGIEWTDETHSIQRGCDPVSPGCAHCWAAAMAARFSAPGEAFAGLAKRKLLPGGGSLAVWTDKEVMLLPNKLLDLLSWRKPKRVFINSVSDTFHADVPFEYIASLWAFMACAPTVTFQIVTKRARRMREFFEWTAANGGPDHWLRCARALCDERHPEDLRWAKAFDALRLRFKAVTARAELTRGLPDMMTLENVWLLVSTENQETYDERVAELLQCPAVVRGISAEPLLGPIDLGLGCWIRLLRPVTSDFAGVPGLPPPITADAGVYRARSNALGALYVVLPGGNLGIKPSEFERLPDIGWAIIGGESGAGCRTNELAWTRGMIAQMLAHNRYCSDDAHVVPFLKQLGGAAVDAVNGIAGKLLDTAAAKDMGIKLRRLKDGHGGDEAEFPADLQGFRRFPVPRIPGQRGAPLSRPAGQLGLAI